MPAALDTRRGRGHRGWLGTNRRSSAAFATPRPCRLSRCRA